MKLRNYYTDPWAAASKQKPILPLPRYCSKCGHTIDASPLRHNMPWTTFERDLANSELIELVQTLAKHLSRRETAILWEFKRQIDAELLR